MTMVSVGEFGKYQRRIFILLCLAGIPFSIFDTGPVFWADVLQYKCNDTRMIQFQRVNHYHTGLNNNDSVNVTQESGNNGNDDDKNGEVNLRDMFYDVPNEGCYLPRFISRKDTDEANTTLANEVNEKQYCANYSFETAYVSIVGRVSTVTLTAKTVNTYDTPVMIRVIRNDTDDRCCTVIKIISIHFLAINAWALVHKVLLVTRRVTKAVVLRLLTNVSDFCRFFWHFFS